MSQPKPALLLLQDGTVFHGTAHGAETTAAGELCFNTGMAGYQEIFTDPSYFGQVIVMTHTHIGNYGVAAEETESHRVMIRAMVCRNFSAPYSRADATGSLQDYLAAQGIPALAGIDTRALVKHIRNRGAMNAILSTDGTPLERLRERLAQCPDMSGLELASHVTTAEPYEVPALGETRHRVAVMDYGVKRNIIRCLAQRGCHLTVFPAHTPADTLLAGNFNGYFLSNGPGDPGAMPYAVQTAQTLTATGKPVFGICLGHQILAQAFGLRTYKMPFGHRGVNHSVRNEETGTCEITSQNHGFAVALEDFTEDGPVRVTHINLNDNTVAGLRHTTLPVFSVQYHPEASPGPHDSRYLFDQFVGLIGRR